MLPTSRALPPLQRSVSTSRQFIVYGTDAPLRGALCDVAERSKSTMLRLLQQTDDWKTPIVVNAQYPQANLPEIPTATFNFSQTGFGLKIQLNLTIAADVNAPEIEREILRAILLEIIYRSKPNLPAGTPYVQPPEWLLDGVFAHNSGSDLAEFGEVLKGFVAAHKVISLEEFLRQNPELLDSPSRAIYRAYSFALVELLTDTPDGPGFLGKFIADLPEAANDPAADLSAHFPVFSGSREKMEKVWALHVARMCALGQYQLLSVAETKRRLDDLLRLRFPSAPQPGKFWNLEDYAEFIRLPGHATILNRFSEDLMLLGTRANPVYRPLVLEYQQIGWSLARGRTRGISGRLRRLKNSRDTITERMHEIDDYMNWFEATQSQTRSGTFFEYLKAADKREETGSRRHDAVSIYIDALESQFRD